MSAGSPGFFRVVSQFTRGTDESCDVPATPVDNGCTGVSDSSLTSAPPKVEADLFSTIIKVASKTELFCPASKSLSLIVF